MSSILEIPIKELNYSKNYISKNKRYQEQYPYIKMYLEKKIKGRSFGNYIENEVMGKIALYAITEFLDFFVEDLEDIDAISAIGDRNYLNFPNGYKGYDVINIEKIIDLYFRKSIQKIIICSFFHQNEIWEELFRKGVLVEDMIFVETVILNM